MGNIQARIIGTGAYLPKKILTNADLEKMVETSDEWIVTRTGMKERYIAAEDEFTSDMGVKAAEIALEKSNVAKEAIDLVLCATITPDYIFPSTSCLIQSKLGLTNSAALDVQAACSGYIYALSVAKAFIEAGLYKNILVVAAEKLSSIVDYTDRNTCVLFGDGAAACVVSDKGYGLLINNFSLGSDGDQAELIKMPAGGSRLPASLETVTEKLHCIKMNGKETFRHAVRRMESAAMYCLEKSNLTVGDIGWLIPHQANLRIMEAIAKRLELPEEKVFVTIHKYGNTSASSVGIALDELLRSGKVAVNDNLLLVAFASGLTWAAALLTLGE